MSEYTYGEEIEYEVSLLDISDKSKVDDFSCGNEKLDYYFHNEIFTEYGEVSSDDGLIFKVVNNDSEDIIAIFSLASNGIIFKQTNYTKVLPSIKIDVFAVGTQYQKMHYDNESKQSSNPDEHFYLSDSIMYEVVKHCETISEQYALVQYILLYADNNAYRFYERNHFLKFESFMEQEHNAEINKNIPMYMKL